MFEVYKIKKYFYNNNISLNNDDDVIDYILSYNLMDAVKKVLKHVNNFFNGGDVVLDVDENYLWIIVFTNIDGCSAAGKIDALEELLINECGDDFLNHILISPEWK